MTDTPAGEGCFDLGLADSTWQDRSLALAEGHHEQARAVGGDLPDPGAESSALLGAESVEAADVEEERERALHVVRQLGHVAVDEDHALRARTAACLPEGTLHVVDPDRLPATLRELEGVPAGAAADVEGTAGARLHVQQPPKLLRTELAGALPGSEADPVHQLVRQRHDDLRYF